MIPIIFAITAFIVWIPISICKKNKFETMKTGFISTIVVALFVIHPNLATNIFASFNCMDVDGEFRLRRDVSELCYQG